MVKIESIWEKSVERPQFDTLKGEHKTDVLVIGGGLTGLLSAYMLKENGIDCILVEAERICGATTANTTAKITLQHGAIYDRMIRRFGVDFARLYLKAQTDAMEKYRELCENIDCDYKKVDAYLYTLCDVEKLKKETAAINKLGFPAEFVEKTSLPFAVKGAVRVKNQAEFNPLKFAFAIAKNLPIYENTRVTELGPNLAVTENGSIRFKKAIVATHFPFLNKHGGYFIKMYQHRSYVLAVKNATKLDGIYVDEAKNGMSFRNYNGHLLIGGGDHRTGKKGGNWEELNRFREKYFPDSRVVAKYATQDCMTLDDIAYIGKYSRRTPNLFVATGFNKWGMTSSMVAAMLLTDLVQGKTNPYARVFSPSRCMLRPQLFINIFEALVGFIAPTAPRCPHLGCALKYNRAEHSWDCSCHGSRFSEKGRLLNNPANTDKRIKRNK